MISPYRPLKLGLATTLKSQLEQYIRDEGTPAVELCHFALDCIEILIANPATTPTHTSGERDGDDVLLPWRIFSADVQERLKITRSHLHTQDIPTDVNDERSGIVKRTGDGDADGPQGALVNIVQEGQIQQRNKTRGDAIIPTPSSLLSGYDSNMIAVDGQPDPNPTPIASNTGAPQTLIQVAHPLRARSERLRNQEKFPQVPPDGIAAGKEIPLNMRKSPPSPPRESPGLHLQRMSPLDPPDGSAGVREKHLKKRKLPPSPPEESASSKKGRYSSRLRTYVPRGLGSCFTAEDCQTTRDEFHSWLRQKSKYVSEEVREGLEVLIFQHALGGGWENLISNVTGWIGLHEVPSIEKMPHIDNGYNTAPPAVQAVLRRVWLYQTQTKLVALQGLQQYVMLYESDREFTVMKAQIQNDPPDSTLSDWVETRVGPRKRHMKAKTWLFSALAQCAGFPNAPNSAGNTPMRAHIRKCRAVGQFCDVMGGPGVLMLMVDARISRHYIYNM